MKKRFNCDQCGKNFTIGCNLKVFIQIVEFNCDHCDKNFTQNTGLKLQISANLIVINVANILLDDAI